MNKRQKKKEDSKFTMRLNLGATSYRQNRVFERAYHEYEVILKRHNKKCADCEYCIGLELCERHIFFLPCVKEKAV